MRIFGVRKKNIFASLILFLHQYMTLEINKKKTTHKNVKEMLQEYYLTKISEVRIKLCLTHLCLEIYCSILLQGIQQIVLLFQPHCYLFQ